MWFLILVLALIILGYWYIYTKQYPARYPPGPRHWVPLIGDPLFAVGSDSIAGFHNLHNKFGPIVGYNFGGHRIVSISDLEILNKVTIYRQSSVKKTHHKNFKQITFIFNMINVPHQKVGSV